MAINREIVLKDFERFKRIAIQSRIKNKIEKSIVYTKAAGQIATSFNFKYCDDDLEENIYYIGESVLRKKELSFKKIPDRVVFYDSFSTDNRGLTQQYLRAIFSWNKEVLYITSQKQIGSQILKELKEYPKSQFYIIPEESFSNKILALADIVLAFKPEKIFLHFSPHDMEGISFWSQIKCSERFLINLTDHAFWFGKSCIDYSLEFRDYGMYISEFERKIPKKKLLFQPYYPIISDTEFKGFPEVVKDKVIAFAGSTYYKIYGDNFKLLNLIKETLLSNDNLVFLFAGSGFDKPIKQFILKNNLGGRFLLIGNRKDISEVFRHIDIFVNTYPMIGGLMSQYAAIMNKPIIGYSHTGLYSFNDTEDLLGIPSKGLLVKTKEEEFITYFSQLINNSEVREENTFYTSNSVQSESGFNKSLFRTITEKTNKNAFQHTIRIDQKKIFDTYLDIEVNYQKKYYRGMLSSLRFRMIIVRPIKFIYAIIDFIISKNMKYFRSSSI